ncbi:GNAT family N-acetyltransferase [Sphingobacterium sp. WQ 366]|uniref:GNAT family N-acetyltransferase n=1 Tax=Sphingobacterium bovistauri TaxID=2781959 RepID=A0ABS7Z0I6_9SPHI|nr:GNAT family N-acetyltransferase [Sphingobacterium bovistauri]
MELHISEEITLRQIQITDAQELFSIIDNERSLLSKWLPFVTLTKELNDTEAYINSLEDSTEHLFEYVFSIRENNKLIGMIGFVRSDVNNHKTEIGYWLSQQYQNKGIMTKSVAAVCKFAFEELAMNRIQIKCAIGNTKSSNIPKRLNFTYEGIERNGELHANGVYHDLEIYSLLRREYNITSN